MTQVDRSQGDWITSGKVKAREAADGVEIVIDGLTTLGRYYKPLVYEFFRKEWRGGRPTLYDLGGDYGVDIRMEHVGDPPMMDLDTLAKALLDAAFATGLYPVVRARALQSNAGSIHVLEKAGFRNVGSGIDEVGFNKGAPIFHFRMERPR